MDPTHDLEKAQEKLPDESSSEIVVVESGDDNKKLPVWKWLAKWGVEVRGIDPVPPEERTKTEYSSIFFMWMAILCNLLPIVTGMAGTLGYGLSLRDTSLVIIFFNLLCCVLTAFLGTLGPKTGMRQVIQARYSFGPYCVSIVAILNLISVVGFTIIAIIICGQTLSAVSDGKMTITVGIVLAGLLGMVVSFCGYTVLHLFNKYSWAITIVSIVIAVGCGGHHLSKPVPTEPATASTILSFGCLIAGFMLPFAGIMSDFAVYYSPAAPTQRMFWYVYVSQNLPTILLMILGAAIGAVVPNVESWNDGYNSYSAGGVLEAMLRPAKGFGKFIAVLLAFSLVGNIAASMYTISLNFQALATPLARVPRSIYTVITTAIMIPVGIKAAQSFFNSLENFLGIVSYWPGAFGAIVTLEHFYFRKGDASTYDQAIWKDRRRLPPGIAAISAGILSFGLIVPCMNTAWFVGPIAKTTGDIGFEVGFVVAGLLYVPFRTLEIKICGYV
ncbi:related to purine-cytosine permease [Phialocephala subalpina]|uniref:Related to purine-cytosine permease n=1 Tax=Phialocephala subalpina TaxID=576137 RepID=A0A1L7WZP9_9HELO|nr:related to purine-cytosine permease [Phialocephala subalpina]